LPTVWADRGVLEHVHLGFFHKEVNRAANAVCEDDDEQPDYFFVVCAKSPGGAVEEHPEGKNKLKKAECIEKKWNKNSHIDRIFL
jgi:hypothetical protein